MKRTGAPITWICNECGLDQHNPNALLEHVWQLHVKEIIERCPWIVEVLWKAAARQDLNKQAVLGRRRSA